MVSDTCWQTVTTSSQFPIRLLGRLDLRVRYKSEHVAIGNKYTDPREGLPTMHFWGCFLLCLQLKNKTNKKHLTTEHFIAGILSFISWRANVNFKIHVRGQIEHHFLSFSYHFYVSRGDQRAKLHWSDYTGRLGHIWPAGRLLNPCYITSKCSKLCFVFDNWLLFNSLNVRRVTSCTKK